MRKRFISFVTWHDYNPRGTLRGILERNRQVELMMYTRDTRNTEYSARRNMMQRFIEVITVLVYALLVGYIFPSNGFGQNVTLHSSHHDLLDPVAIATDGTHLYFGGLNEEGISTILKMPAVGGPIMKIASGDPFVKISGLAVVDQVLYVTDTGNPFDGPAAIYRIHLTALPHDSLPFADLTVDTVRVREERPRIRIEGQFSVGEKSDGIDLSQEDVAVWFGEFSQTLFAGFFVREEEEERFVFEANASGVTEMSIGDDGTFRIIARDIPLPTLDSDIPVRFSLHFGDDAGETRVLLDEEGKFGPLE